MHIIDCKKNRDSNEITKKVIQRDWIRHLKVNKLDHELLTCRVELFTHKKKKKILLLNIDIISFMFL